MSVSRSPHARTIRLTIFFAATACLLFWLGSLVGQFVAIPWPNESRTRVPLQGVIHDAGRRSGLIRFTPLTDHGILADGHFNSGAFAFDEETGPSPGRHRVHVFFETSNQFESEKTEQAGRQDVDYDEPVELEVIVPAESPYRLELELP